jgi:hypothetical protein
MTRLAIALLAACTTAAPHHYRIDAAWSLCGALCDRNERCASSFARSDCEADCVAVACVDGCQGDVADDARVGDCIDAIDVLACDASDAPGVCFGVLR